MKHEIIPNDISSYAKAIYDEPVLDRAKLIAIDMCKAFKFKKNRDVLIAEIKAYKRPKDSFNIFAYNILLSGENLAVIK